MSRYPFRSALSGLFHADASQAAVMLPDGLRPLESHPGLAVLVVTMFDFHTSGVGPYQELVASILVTPWAPRGESMPFAAAFPVVLATSTEASRIESAERWRLPKLDRCLSISIDQSMGDRTGIVSDEGRAVLRLRVTGTTPVDSRRTYQCFMVEEPHIYRSTVEFEGSLSVHEDERGELVLGDHPVAATLARLLDDLIPFREECMDAGEERFGEPVLHAPRRRDT